jgi:hypothetical protein
VGNAGGIIQAVSVVQDWRFAVEVTQAPELLEPAYVTDLPTKRVNNSEARPEELVIIEIGYKLECALARLAEGFEDLIG